MTRCSAGRSHAQRSRIERGERRDVSFTGERGGRDSRGHRGIVLSNAHERRRLWFQRCETADADGWISRREQRARGLFPRLALVRMPVMRLGGETEKEEERQTQQAQGLLTRTRRQLHIGYTSGAKWFPCALNIMAPRYFISKANDKTTRKNPARGGKEFTFPTISIRTFQTLCTRVPKFTSCKSIRAHKYQDESGCVNYESVKISGTIAYSIIHQKAIRSNHIFYVQHHYIRVCSARSSAHAFARSGSLMDKRSKPRLHYR